MKPVVLILCFCLPAVTPLFAAGQETPDTKTAQAETEQSLAEQLKAKPDDKSLLDLYMIRNLGEVRNLIKPDPGKAERILAEMKVVIEALEPETDAGKQIVSQAVRVIGLYGKQIALGRITLEEIGAKLKENPNEPENISMYQSKLLSEISPLTRTQPEQAEKMLNEAKKLLAAIKESLEADDAKKAIEQIERNFGNLEHSIETGRKLAALIGTDAAPMAIETWVNGDPLTDEDLKGKVVLLDFWAVWCGPCIATFPHLREWHEKYSEKGLVIVGLTRYYNFKWNAEEGRAVPSTGEEKVTPEQEKEMLSKFAEQHNLHHRLAIQADSTLSDYYAVTGIPHVVLIDQAGKIKMFRIGSGEQNATDIQEMIKKLIGES